MTFVAKLPHEVHLTIKLETNMSSYLSPKIKHNLYTCSLHQEIFPIVQASFQVKSKNNSDQTLHLGLKAKSWLLRTRKAIYNSFW